MKDKKKKLTIETPTQSFAEAAESPTLGWLEFVLTDDQPNKGNVGIRKEKFASLIQTGLLMPLKMARGGIALDHSGAEPLGVIESLTEDESRILGKAALWKEERAADYGLLREMHTANRPINISWEIFYTESKVDDGVEWLEDPILCAATIVGLPAYAGRTPVLKVASDGDPAPAPAPAPTPAPAPAPVPAPTPDPAMVKELETLRAYKQQRELADKEEQMATSRLKAITDAGLPIKPDDFEKERKVWVSMPDETFTTVVGAMTRLKPNDKPSPDPKVPDVTGNPDDLLDTVRKGLQEMKKAKKT